MGENKHLKSDSIIESIMYRTCLSKKVCIELMYKKKKKKKNFPPFLTSLKIFQPKFSPLSHFPLTFHYSIKSKHEVGLKSFLCNWVWTEVGLKSKTSRIHRRCRWCLADICLWHEHKLRVWLWSWLVHQDG